jgi:preprotein translocase subunit SecY
MFIVLRFLSAIPLPGVNAATLSQFLSNNQLFSFLSIFSGGGLSIMSIMSLGVGPYITASIIMQVLAYVVPSIKEMYHDGGEIGRAQVNQYSRYLSVLFSVLQGFGILALLRSQGVFTDTSLFSLIQNVIILTAGSFLTLWIADLISEFGIGNGTSMIIFAGIVASIPGHISQAMFTYDPSQIIWYVLVIAIIIVVVWITVAINEAERRVQITYTRQSQPGGYVTGGADTYLPLKLTLAGVIPLIFASSLLTLPQIFAQIASLTKSSVMTSIGNVLTQFQNNHLLYGIAYFVLVFLFTYFYAATVFDADSKAEQIQKAGGFIPGVRPGAATADFIGNILSRITFFGAIFLAAIAILPLILQNATGNTVFAIGGTSVLIAVSVVIDLIKKLSAQATMREY